MTRLLIVDDELLVQVGIASMLDYKKLGIEVIGSASNGSIALSMIEEHHPDIIISDIKMPVMDGLELIKTCKARYPTPPIFILLTSYEEFDFVKTAISYEVLEYLVKLELNEEILLKTLQKALQKHIQNQKINNPNPPSFAPIKEKESNLKVLRDKFFIRLLHNLFDSEEQFLLEQKELLLNLSGYQYAIGYCELCFPTHMAFTKEQDFTIYHSTTSMLKELLEKYISCYVVALDSKHICLIFYTNVLATKDLILTDALMDAKDMIYNYFNVELFVSVSPFFDSESCIPEGYQSARQLFSLVTKTEPIIRSDTDNSLLRNKNTFNFSIFKSDIKQAFHEFNATALTTIFTEITSLFQANETHYLQAMDAACNILYLALTLLPEGDVIVSNIFESDMDGYRSIYKCTSTTQVLSWLEQLKTGLLQAFTEKKQLYKNHIVSEVKHYIDHHVEDRILLSDVASMFHISASYLSGLFKKYNTLGFNEYVTQMKIEKAKHLLQQEHLKVYEVADQLGFESSFYFSKVFKKVTGVSPKEFL